MENFFKVVTVINSRMDLTQIMIEDLFRLKIH